METRSRVVSSQGKGKGFDLQWDRMREGLVFFGFVFWLFLVVELFCERTVMKVTSIHFKTYRIIQ